MAMLVVSQAPGGALSARANAAPTSCLPFAKPSPPLFSKAQPRLPSRNPKKRLGLVLASSDVGAEPGPSSRTVSSAASIVEEETVIVGEEGVPVEGVIQFEKSSGASKLRSWAQVGLLVGGDVLCLLAFSAIGRFTHGLPIFDFETLRTADPFIAGWFLSAYFLGGFDEDGRGENGYTKAMFAAAKSWAIGIPIGLVIRAATSGHIPPSTFMLVTMGSTGTLLIGWRALVCSLLSKRQSQRNDVSRRGNPFEFFELLTSLVRRW